MNAAYNCLREAKTRLLHLLELERGTRPAEVQEIPPATMDLFTEVSRHCREADDLVAARANVTSPLLNAQLFERGMALTEKLNSLLHPLNVRRVQTMRTRNLHATVDAGMNHHAASKWLVRVICDFKTLP